MSRLMKEDKLKAFAQELAKDIKTPEDLSALSAQLTKLTVEAALSGEMNHPWVMKNMLLQATAQAIVATVTQPKDLSVITVK